MICIINRKIMKELPVSFMLFYCYGFKVYGGDCMNENIAFMTALQAVEQIKTERISSRQAVESVLCQVEKYNKELNAIVTLDRSGALAQADMADHALKTEIADKPLWGIPVTIKDFFKTSGIRSTASHRPYKDFIPKEDATVVRRLKDAGAIILGKTNMPELAMDCQTDSPLFGRTNNPWNKNRTSGGSSGGGAVAVASGMSFMDVGNDLLGSVRIPSHFCGIYCMIPTEKLIPNTGLLIENSSSDVMGRMMRIGLMARSIEDLKSGVEIVSGPDNQEADGLSIKRITCGAPVPNQLRIGLASSAGGLQVSDEVNAAMYSFISKLTGIGHIVEEINQSQFDFHASRETFLNLFYPVLASGMPSLIRWIARYLGGAKYLDLSIKKYFRAEKTRSNLISQLESIFNDYDILLCPVTATPAFPHMKPDQYTGSNPIYKKKILMEGKEFGYAEANMGFTIPFSVTGNPVITLPIGFSSDGLPIGIQVIGRRYNDIKLLNIASVLSSITGKINYPCN